jgi:hypothetical protein
MMFRSVFAYKRALALAAALALGSPPLATDAVAARGSHSFSAHPGYAVRSHPVYRGGIITALTSTVPSIATASASIRATTIITTDATAGAGPRRGAGGCAA